MSHGCKDVKKVLYELSFWKNSDILKLFYTTGAHICRIPRFYSESI